MVNCSKIFTMFRGLGETSNVIEQKSHIVKLSQKAVARYKAKLGGSLDSEGLFSFAKKHPLRSEDGEILEDGLIFCRMDNNLPKDGYLRTMHNSIIMEDGSRGARNSLHGSLNHAVGFNGLYSWDNYKYLYLIPSKKIPNVVGGTPIDFYTHGNVRIPRGAVIVRQNSSVPEGRYKITNARLIDEFKDLKGVKVIETAQKPHSVSKQILKNLGYEVQNEGKVFGWGDSVDKSFLRFLDKKDLITAIHVYTPNSKCEQMLEIIFNRAHFDKAWEVVKDGKVIFNYKDEYVKFIPYLEELSKKYNYPLDFDVKKIQTIIQQSNTPKEAANRIRAELKYCSSVPQFYSVSEKSMVMQSKVIVGSANEFCRKNDELIIRRVHGENVDEELAELTKKASDIDLVDC